MNAGFPEGKKKKRKNNKRPFGWRVEVLELEVRSAFSLVPIGWKSSTKQEEFNQKATRRANKGEN